MREFRGWMTMAVLMMGLALVSACGDDGGKDDPCLDADKDGHQAISSACPTGDDCDDNDPNSHPGATEICGDNIDQDCSGGDLSCNCPDSDEDGFPDAACGGTDCDDSDKLINPDEVDVCGDDIDQDCSGADTACASCVADAQDGIHDYYDVSDMANHPGCSTETPTAGSFRDDEKNWYTPATIDGFLCAAKEYPFPNGVTEDTTKPIVLLIHGNSDTPLTWEACVDGTNGTDTCLHHDNMLSEQLTAAGFRTYAIDLRFDRVWNPGPDTMENNDARNMDHGWSVPIVQHFIQSVMQANPTRMISIVGHSFGVTTARDALRRLQCAGFNPWPHIKTVVGAAGGNHGVLTYDYEYCTNFASSMKGTVVCEMGSLLNYQPTAFTTPLNGPNGNYETPCIDGIHAFGITGACQGNTVKWHTLVIADVPDGTNVDEFVSESSARLNGADNQTLTHDDIDTSGYFYANIVQAPALALLDGHFGPTRSAAGIAKILGWLSND